jgi:hypothetical protein
LLPVFIRALRKTFRSSLADLSASTKGVIAIANRSAFALSQNLTVPFADPLAGLDGRNLRDGGFIPKRVFSINFLRVLFFEE